MSKKECLYNGCHELRQNKQGSAGRFCSDAHRNAYGQQQKTEQAKTMANLAEAIVEATNTDE